MEQQHETTAREVPNGPAVWTCTCGKTGRATQAYRGEDLLAKAKRNGKQHEKRANR